MEERCTTTNKNKLIVFEEKRSKLTIHNKEMVMASKIIVDGCQITTGIRCDFLFLANEVEFFIELKGQDLLHAVEQIESTIIKLSTNIQKKKKISFIICTRSPLTSASIMNIQAKFRKKFNSELIVKSSPHIYNL